MIKLATEPRTQLDFSHVDPPTGDAVFDMSWVDGFYIARQHHMACTKEEAIAFCKAILKELGE